MKAIEEERDVLMRGIQTVQRAEEWYSEQLSQVEDIPKVPFAQKKNLDHTGTQRYRDTKTQEGHKDTGGTQRHRRDTNTQEGHKDTGGRDYPQKF